MKKSYIPLKNTIISATGTFISRLTGILKFNVVNFLFGAGADVFHSANGNILALRKILGEGPLVSAFLPVFSKFKNEDAIKADKFASNIINQIILISLIVTIIGAFLTPYWTKTFLPGFNNDPISFNTINQLTIIMLFSTIFFSIFSIAMGLLNAHERFITSSLAPIISNIIFIVFPILTYQKLGIISLAWAVVIGAFAQSVLEGIELYFSGFRYRFYINFFDNNSKAFWKLFLPTSINYLAQSGISIGLGYFASFLPKGSMTYLRNANTIMIAPVGFIGVAVAGAIFPVFARVKHKTEELAEAWAQGFFFFLFTSIPIALFFYMYADVIVNIIFRDISRFVSGSTGLFTEDLIQKTTHAVKILSTIIIPWSVNIMIGKLLYSLEKPMYPLIQIIINFIINILGYQISRTFNFGGEGLIYSDLIAGWITLFSGLCFVSYILPQTLKFNMYLLKYTCIFSLISGLVWYLCTPIYQWYLTIDQPLILLIVGSSIFCIGLLLFGIITYFLKLNPITHRDSIQLS